MVGLEVCMYDLKKLRTDLKYVIEKLDYDEVDVFNCDDYISVLLGKTSQKDAIFWLINTILNSRPTDLDDMSIGGYGTAYGHKNNMKIAKELAETDERMAEILQDYIL